MWPQEAAWLETDDRRAAPTPEGPPRRWDGNRNGGTRLGRRPKQSDCAHLCIFEISHKPAIDEALVEDVDESVVLDMGGKAKVPVRCFHAPFFLELGGSLPVVCKAELVS